MVPQSPIVEVQPEHAGLWSRDIQDPAAGRKVEPLPLLKPPSGGHRSNNIDFIRFTLASSVIFSHVYAIVYGGYDNLEPLMRATRNQLSFGSAAVDGFFALSGFLITASWMRSSGFGSYIKKRILRIHPGFAMAMLFCFTVAAPLGHANLHSLFSARQILVHGFGNLILLNGFVEMSAFKTNWQAGIVNGSLWSIRFEFACYLLIPLISLVAARGRVRTLGVLATLGCLICGLGAYLHTHAAGNYTIEYISGWIGLSVRTTTFFMVGAIYYFLRDRVRFTAKGVGLSMIALLVASRIPNTLAIVAPIAGSYLIFWLAFSRFLPFQGFGRYGDFSYGVYLYGCPIQQLLAQWYPHLSTLSHFMIAWSAATAAGVLSYYCVERPFMRMKPKSAPAMTKATVASDRVSEMLERIASPGSSVAA